MIFSGSITLSRIVFHGSSGRIWNASADPHRLGADLAARYIDVALAGFEKTGDFELQIVDLPQPEGPTSATKSPLAIARLTAASA